MTRHEKLTSGADDFVFESLDLVDWFRHAGAVNLVLILSSEDPIRDQPAHRITKGRERLPKDGLVLIVHRARLRVALRLKIEINRFLAAFRYEPLNGCL